MYTIPLEFKNEDKKMLRIFGFDNTFKYQLKHCVELKYIKKNIT